VGNDKESVFKLPVVVAAMVVGGVFGYFSMFVIMPTIKKQEDLMETVTTLRIDNEKQNAEIMLLKERQKAHEIRHR
jgi:hypothetical protein